MVQKAHLIQCAAFGLKEPFYYTLRRYILTRLGLPEAISQTDLYELCVLSIKLQLHGTGDTEKEGLEERLRKFDCHQTEVAVQKKVLLLMHLERLLEVRPAPGGSIRTLEDLSKYLYSQLRREDL